MSNELLKKLGLGLAALLVVCNTVQIQGMKKHSKKTREAFSGMRARMGEASKMQRPAVDHRRGRGQERGQRPDRGKDGKKSKQQKPEVK